MNDKPINGIWGPNGFIALDGKQPTRQELKAGLGVWFARWGDAAPVLKVSLTCDLCGTIFQGKNSENERTHSVVCGCRELIWSNPDYKPPTEFSFYEQTS